MKKGLMCILIMLVMLIFAVPARAEEHSGVCGEGLSWSFDQATGVLTISGEGQMGDYLYDDCPWAPYRQEMTSAVIEDGVKNIGRYSFKDCQALISVSISNTVETIDGSAFSGCTALKSIYIPDSVIKIGYSAFSSCTALENVRIPATVNDFQYAFNNCTALREFILPDGLQKLSMGCFANCSNLKNVVIPASVKVIETRAFSECHGLRNVVFMGNAPDWADLAFYNLNTAVFYTAGDATWTKEKQEQMGYPVAWVAVENPGEVKLPKPGDPLEGYCGDTARWSLKDGVLTITGSGAIVNKPWAEYSDQITSVVVEKGITTVGSSVFSLSNLQKVTLPDTVTDIGGNAFRKCTKLEEIKLPASVTSIGARAFWECVNLKRIEIPSGVKNIEAYTFHNCDALVEVILPDSLECINERAFQSCDNLPKIVFPKNLKTIGESAFAGCNSLKTVIFRGDAPKIHQFAFNQLSFDAYYPAGNKTWNESVFHSFLGNKNWIAGTGDDFGACGTGVTWKIEGNTLTISGNGRMTDYYPDAMAPWTGYSAQIEKLVIKSGVTYIGKYAFTEMTAIKTVQLPEGLTAIGGAAFSACNGIEEIRIPDSVKEIGNSCFGGMHGLKKLTLGPCVEKIADYAFYDCPSLQEVTFPATLKSLGRYAFSMCTGLKTATFLGGAPTIAQDTFELDRVTIYYPAREESWSAAVKRYFLGVNSFVADCIPDHTMGQWEVTKEPTLDLCGEEKRTCLYCDEFEVREVPKLTPKPPETTNPTQPTNPPETTNPSEPTNPTQPSQPEETEPSQPAVTEATEPKSVVEKTENGDHSKGIIIVIIVVSVAAIAAVVTVIVLRKRK